MKLVEIWASAPSWNTLSALKISPQIAYRLYKYKKLVDEELQACESQRVALIHEACGTGPPKIEPGTDQFNEFLNKFNVYLQQESDLKPLDISMETLIEALGDAPMLSENDISILEAFFQI
jgi:hypothetical protein